MFKLYLPSKEKKKNAQQIDTKCVASQKYYVPFIHPKYIMQKLKTF